MVVDNALQQDGEESFVIDEAHSAKLRMGMWVLVALRQLQKPIQHKPARISCGLIRWTEQFITHLLDCLSSHGLTYAELVSDGAEALGGGQLPDGNDDLLLWSWKCIMLMPCCLMSEVHWATQSMKVAHHMKKFCSHCLSSSVTSTIHSHQSLLVLWT